MEKKLETILIKYSQRFVQLCDGCKMRTENEKEEIYKGFEKRGIKMRVNQ